MQSFRDLDRHFATLPLDVVTQLSAVAEGRGREAAARLSRPRELAMLQELAIVRSIDTSNAIEGVTAPPTRIVALAKLAAPRNRPEQEIAGYRYALGQIHEHAPDIPFEPRYVLQLHGYLYRYTGVRHAGEFKRLDNRVEERRPDGTTVQRFLPLAAARTPAAMQELHDGFAVADDRGGIPYPLLCAAYVLDFLTIHPFTDGNGRMSRLITSWLLYRGGFDIARFISLEQIVSDTSADYYDALAASTVDWHENRHDAMPWTRYFLGMLVGAYRELDEHMSAIGSSSASKRNRIVGFIAERPQADFSVADVRAAVPDVSRDYLGVVLRELRDEGAIKRTGAGRGSRWMRVAAAERRREL